MAIMDTAEDNNIQLGCMVDVKLHISWKVNKLLTHDEDLVSLKG